MQIVPTYRVAGSDIYNLLGLIIWSAHKTRNIFSFFLCIIITITITFLHQHSSRRPFFLLHCSLIPFKNFYWLRDTKHVKSYLQFYFIFTFTFWSWLLKYNISVFSLYILWIYKVKKEHCLFFIHSLCPLIWHPKQTLTPCPAIPLLLMHILIKNNKTKAEGSTIQIYVDGVDYTIKIKKSLEIFLNTLLTLWCFC